ncbi:hypothetical protein JAAARDRAFT_119974 [Jaapia argillacea MUCL 33604]|uniref:Uncharacterized protein n=1 Tax=Jaapia argillacea MUCL 33604 TaxID=933084 RepID=A0A067Q997_9AGAM|nr:hypothetical protein JAAARDRAFT_119974 [Jaapia argillacea MUCL 33604]
MSPRVPASGAPARRGSVKAATPHPIGETRETLAESLRRETEEKEQLLVKLQNKEQLITTLTTESDKLSSALNAAEGRLTELYTDQSRMEDEMAGRIDVIDKLRIQARDLEKEKRELQRRYFEQTATFEAERQAFYDNEQHLKSRIQSLTQARQQPIHVPSDDHESEGEHEDDEADQHIPQTSSPLQMKQDLQDEESEPAEMTSLRLELSTLSTSYSSLQSTLVLLQTQLMDLKRVNRELQEENESYNILLTEKTLSGQYHVMKQVEPESEGTTSEEGEDGGEDADDDDESLGVDETVDRGSLKSAGRSTLGRVDELAEESTLADELERSLEPSDPSDARSARHSTRRGHRRNVSGSESHSPGPRGESLADLPITGPGLDLAAELGRAENKDILAGNAVEERDRSILNGKKRGRKSVSDAGKKVASSGDATDAAVPPTDIENLRNEVKSLKDANKALSLYASKIIDRIIAQEGFEHVLAVDYDKMPPPTPVTKSPLPTTFDNTPAQAKSRPQSAIFAPPPAQEKLTTFNSPPLTGNTPVSKPTTTTRNRRSLSFDWRNFSLFNANEKKAEGSPNLRQLTLKPGANSIVGARKLDTQEDEEDRRERERTIATMKLMGIDQPTVSSSAPPIEKVQSAPVTQTLAMGSPVPSNSSSGSATRFSLFRSRSTTHSETSSLHSSHTPPIPSSNLTQEALAQAEAESKLAALDAHERALSAEIAKGASGGFTEITRSRRGRKSAGGSGSTVWSAGMNGEDGDD